MIIASRLRLFWIGLSYWYVLSVLRKCEEKQDLTLIVIAGETKVLNDRTASRV